MFDKLLCLRCCGCICVWLPRKIELKKKKRETVTGSSRDDMMIRGKTKAVEWHGAMSLFELHWKLWTKAKNGESSHKSLWYWHYSMNARCILFTFTSFFVYTWLPGSVAFQSVHTQPVGIRWSNINISSTFDAYNVNTNTFCKWDVVLIGKKAKVTSTLFSV